MEQLEIEMFIEHTEKFKLIPDILYGEAWVTHAINIAKELLEIKKNDSKSS